MLRPGLSTFFIFVFPVLVYGQDALRQADSLVAKALPLQEHGLSVLVTRGDEVLYHRQAGYADVEGKTWVDGQTLFRIGSVTKQFTASAILKLVEMGKLELDDPLEKFIPGFPKGDEVTIHHLLTHTSGIKSYTDQPSFLKRVTSPVIPAELVKEIQELGYDFEPGEQWKYNNSAYYLLGYLVEHVSKMSYGKFLSKHLFKPAGMKNTGVYNNKKSHSNEALGYAMEVEGGIKKALDWQMSWAGAAGNLYSTAEDLEKWNRTLFSGKVLSKESLQKAHAKVKLNDGSEHPYGYGWGLNEYRGLRRIGHSGGLHGFLSYLVYYPSIEGTIVVLSNCSPPKNVVPGSFAEKLTDIFFKEHLEENKAIPLDSTVLDQYVGQYEYPGSAIMTISREGEHLFAQLTGQNGYEIFPKGDHTFFWKVVPAEVKFVMERGQVTAAMHKQGGGEFKAMKLKARQAITLEAGVFDNYTGKYDLMGQEVSVWEEDGAFFAQVSGQPKARIFPTSKNRFFMKDMAVDIEFETHQGVTQGLIIHQSGRQVKASKKE